MQVQSDQEHSIGTRLRGERERLALTQQQVADAIASLGLVGGTRQSQRKYETDVRHPDAPYLSALAGMGFDVLYVLTGQRVGQLGDAIASITVGLTTAEQMAPWLVPAGPTTERVDTTRAGGLPGAIRVRDLPDSALLPVTGAKAARPLVLSCPLGGRGEAKSEVNYHVIPRHMRGAAAGAAAVASSDTDQLDRVGEMAFSGDWMRHHLGGTVGPLTSIKVKGDSMAATLLDGDTIIIDQGVGHVDVDGIYVLDVYGRRLVKRVQMLYDGALVLISDNAAYERQTIPRDTARDVRVIGRMVWPRIR